jgi:hypothetical protein
LPNLFRNGTWPEKALRPSTSEPSQFEKSECDANDIGAGMPSVGLGNHALDLRRRAQGMIEAGTRGGAIAEIDGMSRLRRRRER